MAAITIKQFGGEYPSLSPRALPTEAAQSNRNLYLGVPEFRPLKTNTTVTSATSGYKSIFRHDAASAWITWSECRSFVRGQIYDDTTKRAYFTTDTGAQDYLRDVDSTAASRRVGVPAPAKPVVAFTESAITYLSHVAEQVRIRIAAMEDGAEPYSRFNVGGTVIYGGPQSNYGLNWPTESTGFGDQYSSLFAAVNTTRQGVLSLDSAALGAIQDTGSTIYVPLTCLPYTFQQDAPLYGKFQEIVNARTSVRVFTNAQCTTLSQAVQEHFWPDNYALAKRGELDGLVREFAHLLLEYVPVATWGTAPTKPIKPTVPEFTYSLIDDVYTSTRSALWDAYDDDFDAWEIAQANYLATGKSADEDIARVHARLKEIQTRCASLTSEIEVLGQARWNEICLDPTDSWVTSRLYSLGGLTAMPNIDAERVYSTRFYAVTFVNDRAEESAPSPPSEMLKIDQYGTTTITLPTVTAGRNIAGWRIYRTNTGSASTNFQFAYEVTIPEVGPPPTSYVDTVDAEDLAEIVPSLTWLEPEIGLRGLVGLPNGVMAAFKGSTVHFCDPYHPFAWPAEYQIVVEHPIVAMGVFGQTLFVGTTGSPYFISGADPASMSSLKLESPQACVSARSVVPVQGGVLYASPDGLCVADGSGVKVVTQGLYTREDWSALTPSLSFAVAHENIYYFFHGAGCLTFDLGSMRLGRLEDTSTVTAAYTELLTDAVYLLDGANIKQMHAASTTKTGVWKSAVFSLPQYTGFAWASVIGSHSVSFPATLKWYGDGVLRHTAVLTDNQPVRMPPGRYTDHEIELSSQARVTSVRLASDVAELKA